VTCLPDECKITDPEGIGKIGWGWRENSHTHTATPTERHMCAVGWKNSGKINKEQKKKKNSKASRKKNIKQKKTKT